MEFDHQGTLPERADQFLTGVTNIVVAESSLGSVLYTTSRSGGGDLLAYRIEADGGLALLDSRPIAGQAQAGTVNTLNFVEGRLYLTGAENAALTQIEISDDGTFSSVSEVTGAALPAQLLATETLEVNGLTFMYGITRGSDAVDVWQMGGAGVATLIEGGNPGDASQAALTGMSVAFAGGVPFLLVASDADNALISMSVGSDGRPREVSRISSEDGIGIASPTATAFAEVGGQSFGVLAAADSSTLSVVRLGSDGSLQLTDHVLDTRDTRFDGVHTIETASFNGRAYLAAAGGDDGVSVFELLEDGRLLHLTTIADETGTTMSGVSALSFTLQGSALHLAVASGAEAGLSVFTLDIASRGPIIGGTTAADVLDGGTGDDYLYGEAGNDAIAGHAGDDIIRDGAGLDVLTGGEGRDLFVLSDDGVIDTIADFDINQDRIDLSGWSFLRSNSQILFQSTAEGGVISFGAETLELKTVDGSPLTIDQIQSLNLVGQSRFMPDWVLPDQPDSFTEPAAAAPVSLIGTAQADVLSGGDADDLIHGLEDNDKLSGGGGGDQIKGGAGDDAVYGNAGNDLAEGGEGADSIWGGIGWDTIRGNEGNDVIVAGDGFDAAGGGDGDDIITGNNGADKLYGDAGDDRLTGGLNADSLWGGTGEDQLGGSAGSDALYGGEGNDQLFGNAGADVMEGDGGNDRLAGGINNDTLNGGAGRDTLQGDNGSDVLIGGAGNDLLKGNAGSDILDGGAGDDVLSGGIGADRFKYGSGNDTIMNFQDGIDKLVLDPSLWGGGAISASQLHMYVQESQSDYITLDFGNGNSLDILNVEMISILDGDFEVS